MKLNDISVPHKLWGTILGLLLLILSVTGFTQYRVESAMEKALADVEHYEGQITAAVSWRGMTAINNERALASLTASDAKVEKFFAERMAATSKEITALAAEIEAKTTNDEGKQALARVREQRAAALAVRAKSADIKASGDPMAINHHALNEVDPANTQYIAALDGLVKMAEKQRDASKVAALETRHQATLLGIVTAALVVLAAVVLARVLVRSVTQPLARAVAAAQAISAGDLTGQLHDARRDEFGQLLRALSEMTARLHGLVSEVRTGVESVSSASTQIANGNQDLSGRTEQTAGNLQETAASMEQFTSTVAQSAETARQANQLAASAAEAAQRGGEVVGHVVHSMQQITDSSRKIGDIIGVIDGIAFQTNILALNAAVEAARAGEQGRGFAVVAGEVRSLAQRSAEAAKEIKSLISTSVDEVEAGSSQVKQAGLAMEQIVGSVRRVSDLIGEITASSTERRDGIGQVNQAVSNLDQMTQQNAALVEESAAATSALRDQAQRLAEVVSVFNVGEQGMAVRHAPAPVASRPAAPARPALARAAPVASASADEAWESF